MGNEAQTRSCPVCGCARVVAHSDKEILGAGALAVATNTSAILPVECVRCGPYSVGVRAYLAGQVHPDRLGLCYALRARRTGTPTRLLRRSRLKLSRQCSRRKIGRAHV